MSYLPRGLALGLPRLAHLDLSNNSLPLLPADAIGPAWANCLVHLDLSRNRLQVRVCACGVARMFRHTT